MLIAFLVVLGLFSYRRLAVDLFPNIDFPIVTVTTTLNGAGVEEMETGVTKPLEEAINTIQGIDELRSVTKEGLSQLQVIFVLERDREAATQDVRDKVSSMMSSLPEGTDAPVVDKFDPESSPILSVAVSGPRDLREVTEIARKMIKEDIETLHGVGSVSLAGGLERAVN
ncbi:MAG TPA: efflux RND transporter permease subunit, partial [Pseudomonadales bacterium]|nr:efflux RND transporter permease subunit [Pseudomonadales bacterium]